MSSDDEVLQWLNRVPLADLVVACCIHCSWKYGLDAIAAFVLAPSYCTTLVMLPAHDMLAVWGVTSSTVGSGELV